MNFESKLLGASSLHDLHLGVSRLQEEEKIYVSRQKIRFSKSKESLSLAKLEKKIDELFTNEIKNRAEATDLHEIRERREACQELCAIIFQLEHLPEQADQVEKIAKRLGKIKKEAIQYLHQDPGSIQRAEEAYDKYSSHWNENLDIDEGRFSGTSYQQAKFLKEILGISWTSRQEKGLESIPAYGEPTIESSEEKIKENPRECHTLRELNGYLVNLAKEHRKNDEVQFFDNNLRKTIESQIFKLYKNEEDKAPPLKGTLAFHTMSAIEHLNLHSPKRRSSSRQKKLEALFKQCQKDFAQDRSIYLKTYELYLGKGMGINDALIKSRSSAPIEKWTKEDRQTALFLAKALGLDTTPEMMSGEDLFPELLASTLGKYDMEKIQLRFNWHSLVLNQELKLGNLRRELEEVERMLNPNFYSNLLTDNQKIEELKERKVELDTLLVKQPDPLPNRFFQRLWEEQLMKMEDLKLEPTDEQKKRLDFLPVWGSQKQPLLVNRPPLTHQNLLSEIHETNRRIEAINFVRQVTAVQRKIVNLEGRGKDDYLDDELREAYKLQGKLKNNAEWEVLDTYTTKYLSYLATVIYHKAALKTEENLTEEEITGNEPIPLIDLTKIPCPPLEKIVEDLSGEHSISIKSIIENDWPEHWKEKIPHELKKYIL